MAKITLDRNDCRNGFLPHRCLRCGQPTEKIDERRFSWVSPNWYLLLCIGIGILIVIIVRILLTKRMTVDVPICARHRNHWTKCYAVSLVVIITNLALMVAGFATMDGSGKEPSNLVIKIFYISLLVSIPLLILAYKMQIHPTYIDEFSITLSGVNQEVKEEVEKLQKAAEEKIFNQQYGRMSDHATAYQPKDPENKPKDYQPPDETFKFD